MDGTLAAITAFVTALAVTIAVTPLFGRIAVRTLMVARRRPDRWATRDATPLLGGAAIGLAVLLAVLPFAGDVRTIVVIAGAMAAMALGLIDDKRHLAASTKLVGQVVVASFLVLGGVQVEIVPYPPLAFLLTVIWVVAMMNALNLIDNMDGLAAGVAGIAALTLAATALPENPAAALIAAATAGASFGFLVHNFWPARIFMGDGGSHLLGFLLAAVALLHTASAATNVGLALLGPLAVLALPIFDTALVTASRGIAGRSLSRGGRDHTSHRLAALGLSDRAAVLVLYGIAAALAVVGAVVEAVSSSFVLPLVALAVIALALFGLFLHEVEVYGEGSGQPSTRGPERKALHERMYLYVRFGAEVGLDAALLTIAYVTSYLIRFEGVPESAWMSQFVQSVPIVIAVQLAALVGMRVYRTLWRYLSVADAMQVVRAATVGTAAAAFAVVLLFRFEGYSRAVFVLDGVLAAALLSGSRAFLVWLRHWFALRPRPGARRVLIVGASDPGLLALQLLARSRDTSYRVIGFIDDDPGKRYRRLSGIPILGTVADLADRIARHEVSLVVAALESREHERIAEVRRSCEAAGVEFRQFAAPV